MRIGLFVASGEINFRSALSSISRTLEELKVDEVVIFHTTNSRDNAERIKGRLEYLEVKVKMVEIPGDKEPMILRLKELMEYREAVDVALISPAGASLASMASLVFKRIAHVSFPFGMWSGLTYPYVPRWFQRLNVISENVERGGIDVSSFRGEVIGGKITTSVAEITKKINESVRRSCINDECEPIKLKMQIRLMDVKTYKQENILNLEIKDETTNIKDAVLEGRRRLREAEEKLYKKKKVSVGGLDSIIWLSGMLSTFPSPEIEDRRKTLILDTSAILLGALNWRARGYKVRVPRCALYELIHKYEEAVKPTRGRYNLVGLLGKALVNEVKQLGLLYPSSPDLCDKALLQMDPYLLHNTYVVTADKGIKMMWDESPLERLAPLVMVEKGAEPEESFPNRFYSVIHAMALFKIIEEELRSHKEFLKEMYGEGEEKGIGFAGELYAEDKKVEEFLISL